MRDTCVTTHELAVRVKIMMYPATDTMLRRRRRFPVVAVSADCQVCLRTLYLGECEANKPTPDAHVLH